MSDTQTIKALLDTEHWRAERKLLRSYILDFGLIETVKWGRLCYTYEDSNIVIIYGMKDYCALGFFKGALINDDQQCLVAPGKDSQAMRQLRFHSRDDIIRCAPLIKSYLAKAIQIEKDGLTISFDAKRKLVYPHELQAALDADPALAQAFSRLTPGRQRGYVLHIEHARQAATRVRRIDTCRPKILAGKGHNER